MHLTDPTSGVPVFRQMADQLREEIASGSLRPGALLPSERMLMDRYGVARGTVRQALQVLKAEGLVEARHGKGVFVRTRPLVFRVASDRFSRERRRASKDAFAAEAEAHGLSWRQELHYVGTTPATKVVAARLGVPVGETVFVRRRRMWAGDMPMQLADSYFPYSMVKGSPITEEDTGPGGTYARIEDLGHELARFREELTARMPSPEEASSLRLSPGIPVVALVRTAFDTEGVAVEVFDSVLSADKYAFAYEFPAT